MTPVPHPPCSPNLTLSGFLFLFPRMKKALKGKRFADVEEAKQNNGRSTKGHQNQQVRKLLSNGKNISIGVLHQMERT